jgi:hypothetical protein
MGVLSGDGEITSITASVFAMILLRGAPSQGERRGGIMPGELRILASHRRRSSLGRESIDHLLYMTRDRRARIKGKREAIENCKLKNANRKLSETARQRPLSSICNWRFAICSFQLLLLLSE